MIIATVGLAGVGKSVVTEYLQQKYGCKSIYFGGIVVNETIKRYGVAEQQYEKIVRENLRNIHGKAAMAILSVDLITLALQEHSIVIIDGMYSFSEYKYLKELYNKKLVVIATHAPRGLRYERLSKRTIRPLAPQGVDERDYAEIENIEKGGPIAIADYHIINDGSLEDLYNKLDKLLLNIETVI